MTKVRKQAIFDSLRYVADRLLASVVSDITLGSPAWETAGAAEPMSAPADRESELQSGRWLFADGGNEPRRVTTQRRRQQQTAASDRQRAEASQRDSGSGGSSSGGSSGGGGGGRRGGGFPTRAGGGATGIGILVLVAFFILRSCMGGGDGDTTQQLQQAAQNNSSQGDVVQQVLEQVVGGAGNVISEGQLPPEVQQLLTLFGANTLASAGQVQEVSAPIQPSQPLATLAPMPTSASAAAAVAGAGGTAGGDTWTVLLYQDADDKVLERDIHVDLNEAERADEFPNVRVVAQLDRYNGGYNGDGNVTGAKRYLVRHDEDLDRIGSQELMDLGEINMADGNTLVDFVEWGMQNFPADKYALILSDHGMGWPGGFTDPTATGGADRNNPMSQVMGDILYLNEIDDALQTIRDQTGLEKFELIGLDACLMSDLAVYSALEPHARYAVASQETEPAVGWAYAGFINRLGQNPEMTGGGLGNAIVESYIVEDQRILDPQARAEFARGSAQQVASQLYRGVTLTAVDLSQVPALNSALNDFVYALQGIDQKVVAKARSYAQSFTNIFGNNVPPSYLDLGHFLLTTAQASKNNDVINAARPVAEALQNLVVDEMHGQDKPSATGVSIYFPNSDLIRSAAAGPQAFGVIAERFVNESLWDDFLTFHYTGNQFQEDTRTAAIPADTGAMRSPATGGIEVGPAWSSADEVAIQDTVLLTTTIDGENLGYVKLMVGELDADANSLRLIDADYLEAPQTIEMRGSYYPEWGEGAFILEFEWEPYVTAITDGVNTAPALFTPENYGKNSEDAIYSVDGEYTIAPVDADDVAETRYARMYFRDGVMTEVYGFSGGSNSQGAPAQITTKPGDTFTVLDVWLDLNDDGSATQVQQPGQTYTMGDEPLRWVEMDAAAGQYTVGFIVEDLDGQEFPTYTQIEVLP